MSVSTEQPIARNLAQDVEDRAREAPDAVGVIFEDGRRWTFAEFDAAASAAGRGLQTAGLRPGDRVALHATNGPDLLFTLYGAWKIGAVPVAISALYNAAEFAGSLEKATPRLVVGSADVMTADKVDACGTVPIRLLESSVDGGLEVLARGDDTPLQSIAVDETTEAVILFTGGTTGRPKAVSVTHVSGQEAAATLARAAKGRPGPYPIARPGTPPNIIALPLFHSGGQFTSRFAFHVGRGIVLLERFRLETLRRVIEANRPDNLFLLPTMVYDIVHAEEPLDLSTVRSVLIAGQAISPQLQREFETKFEIPIAVDYGSTEIGQVAGWTARDRQAGNWKPGSVGRIFEGIRVEIRNAGGEALPAGEVGEVVVNSGRTPTYVGDREATDALVVDGWVHSGDVGYLDDDNVLFLVGRSRDMIKCGGFQVWPQEIEDELQAHPLVSESRVVGVPDDRLGEIPRAYVVRTPDPNVSDDVLREQLVAFTRERLAHFKTPREFVFTPELPRSEVGKIRRDVLPDDVS
jgi:long-chain acyl-CoA synthetase